MAVVSELELPLFDHTDPTLGGERYRAAMAALHGYDGWLAQCPFGFMVLDREAAEFFLRTKEALFPGLTIARAVRDHRRPAARGDRPQHHQHQRRRPQPAAQPRQPGAGAARDRPLPPGDARLPGPAARRLPADGRCEFIEAFAKPYPSLVIAAVMGAPLSDAPKLYDWSNWIQRQFDANSLTNERDADRAGRRGVLRLGRRADRRAAPVARART